MIAATYTQGKGFAIAELPVPEIDDDELLVRIEAASICGTDVKMIGHGHRKLRDGQRIVLGHEFVGRVAKAGARVRNFQGGMRVGVAPNIGCGHCEMCAKALMNMCPNYSAFGIDRDGAHTEYVRIPAAAIAQGNVLPLSETLSPTSAVLAEPLSCAINGVRAAQVALGDSVLIYGSGPMGLLNLMVAAAAGASRLIMVDLNPARLELAKRLGATEVINPQDESVRDWVGRETNGRGVDVVIVAVPVRQAQQEGIHLLAPFGRLSLFAGLPKDEAGVELDTNAIHYRNLMVTGTTGGAPQDYRAAVKMIESGKIRVAEIVSDTLPIQDLAKAYELAQSGQRMKIVVTAESLIRNGKPDTTVSGKTDAVEPSLAALAEEPA
jgi:L-iditol 2-dehydrogenase